MSQVTKNRTTAVALALAGVLLAACSRERVYSYADEEVDAGRQRAPHGDWRVQKSDAAWRSELTPSQYHVLRERGTQRAFTGEYCRVDDPGTYRCAGCAHPLFDSDDKFDSASAGWPSFSGPIAPATIAERLDFGYAVVRTEVLCATCGGHLGHVFDDGPPPTGRRYCINSASMELILRRP